MYRVVEPPNSRGVFTPSIARKARRFFFSLVFHLYNWSGILGGIGGGKYPPRIWRLDDPDKACIHRSPKVNRGATDETRADARRNKVP